MSQHREPSLFDDDPLINPPGGDEETVEDLMPENASKDIEAETKKMRLDDSKRSRPRNISAAEIEAALRACGGFISLAARRLGVTYHAVYYRLKRNPKLQEIQKEIDEQYLDLAESKLIQKVKAGELGAICFYLKCKGKSRGYIERQEVDLGNEGQDVIFNMNVVGGAANDKPFTGA